MIDPEIPIQGRCPGAGSGGFYSLAPREPFKPPTLSL